MSPTFGPLPMWMGLPLVALATLLVAAGWRGWAERRGLLDVPGHRSSHAIATPRGAGVAIAASVVAGLFLAVPASLARDAAVLAVALAATVGLLDDWKPLRPAWKLVGQGLAGLPVALAFPFPEALMPFALPSALAGLASWALVLLFVNAWNFMDGINGIAALAAASVGAVAWGVSAGLGGLAPVLGALLLFACLGFLPMNFPQARVFMGDCGSHVLGMAVTLLVLSAPEGPAAWAALAASAAFLVDVLGTLILRAADGERLSDAHRRHLYQLVTRCGYSHARVSVAYAAWMLGSGGFAAMVDAWTGRGDAGAAVVAAVSIAVWSFLVRRFSRDLRRQGRW